jgi:hypothetical protein
MCKVHTFAGLALALALAFSLTTAAQTSSTESKQKASPLCLVKTLPCILYPLLVSSNLSQLYDSRTDWLVGSRSPAP